MTKRQQARKSTHNNYSSEYKQEALVLAAEKVGAPAATREPGIQQAQIYRCRLTIAKRNGSVGDRTSRWKGAVYLALTMHHPVRKY